MDPRKPIVGSVTAVPFLYLLVIITLAVVGSMLFTGRLYSQEQELQARKLELEAKLYALKSQSDCTTSGKIRGPESTAEIRSH